MTGLYTDAELRGIDSFDDAFRLARKHGTIHATRPRSDVFRVLTTTGIREIMVTDTGRRAILAHWTAIYAYVVRGESAALEGMRGAQVDGVELECRSDIISGRHRAGELPELRREGERASWRAPWLPREHA